MTRRKTGKVSTRILSGPFCEAPKRDGTGRTCKQPAGYRTAHPGQGQCRFHGGLLQGRPETKNGKIVFGRYSKISNRRVADIMEELVEQDTNALDLMPEVQLLRALTIDYINRYDEFVEALMAWYMDPDTKQRPKRAMDISEASTLIDTISRIVHRMHTIQSEGAITLDTFRRVTEHMGIIVAGEIRDEATLKRIEQKWADLVLDARSPPLLPPDGSPAIDAEFSFKE